MADSASWTDRNPAERGLARVAPGQRRRRRPRCAGGPGAAPTGRPWRGRARRWSARRRARRRRRPRPGPPRPATNASSWSSRALDGGDQRRPVGERPHAGHAPQQARRPLRPRRPCRSSASAGEPAAVERVRPRHRAQPSRSSALGVGREPGLVRMATIPHMGGRGYVGGPGPPGRRPGRPCDPLGLVVAGRLDHHPHERLGAARPHQHPAVAPSSASAAATSASHGRRGGHRRPRHPHVDQHLGQAGHRLRGQLGQRAAGPLDDVDQDEAGEDAVAGRGQVGEDHVAALLAAQREAAGLERLEHVAVADGRLDDVDAGLAPWPGGSRGCVITVTTTVSWRSRPRRWRSSAQMAMMWSPSTTAPVWSTAISRSPSPSKARPSVGTRRPPTA